jgi:hypothetical protein
MTDSSPDKSAVLVLTIVVLFWKSCGDKLDTKKHKLPALAIWGTKSTTVGDRLVVMVELPPSRANVVSCQIL